MVELPPAAVNLARAARHPVAAPSFRAGEPAAASLVPFTPPPLFTPTCYSRAGICVVVVPGLLQTPDYARAVLGWGPDDGDDLDERVAA
jgi:hypothetical protein